MELQKQQLFSIFENLDVSNLVGSHVFIDFSNIKIGAMQLCPDFKDFKLLELVNDLTKTLPSIKRILASSIKVNSRPYGYETHILPTVRGSAEVFVDELLYFKISDSLLDYERGLLVLVTGDGNISEYGLGFPMQIVRAIKRNWTVRLLTWRNSMASIYLDIAKKYPNQFSIYYLDAARHRLT